MPDELPIACTLGARDFASREALIARLGRDALIDAIQHGPNALLRFAAADGMRDRLDSFVAGERACCAFLTMTVAQFGEEIELRIHAPAAAEPVLAEMVAAFQPHPEADRAPTPRGAWNAAYRRWV
jgi:hypothetical protein